jgi:hypothetical protein
MATKSTSPKSVAAAVMAREHRATRPACAAVKTSLFTKATEIKVPVASTKLSMGKPNDCKPGLRFNIVAKVQSVSTVGEALGAEVYGKPGSKHDSKPYAIKMTDVVFCITNGFVSAK